MIIDKSLRREKLELADSMKQLIESLTNCPLSQLPEMLRNQLNWNRPRGDLYHWIPLLNRFDKIFEDNIEKYGLEDEFIKLTIMSREDQDVLITSLNFTSFLLEYCCNRVLYSSRERIFPLINTPTLSVRLAALEVAVALTQSHLTFKSAAPSKDVRNKVVSILHTYPPMVPSNFKLPKSNDNIVLGDHYSFVQSVKQDAIYPDQWKLIHFSYYKIAQESSKKSPKKSKSKSKSSNLETLCAFVISPENVRKLSIEQIFDRASEAIPKHLWFDFALHAYVVKAFNSKDQESIKLREDLLRCKLYSLAFIISWCSEDFVSSRVFEPEPYILNFVVEMITPQCMEDLSSDVFFLAVETLQSISLKRVWGNELIRCLGANVNHGIMYQTLRHIHKKLINQDSDCPHRAYIQFFNMLGNLIETKSLFPKLAAGGTLKELMSFLDAPQKYRWEASAAIHLVAVFLSSPESSLDDFVNLNGFQLLIDTIGSEVDFALENPNFDGGAPKDSVVYYTISFRQANYLRNLMILVSHLIQWDTGDRLRNLFDSPLLQSFNKIITNPHTFGPMIVASTIDTVFYIIHNEPTAFAILSEARVINTILDNFEGLFLPDCDLVLSLAEVLGAISLNKEGLKEVESRGCIATLFDSFKNPKICRSFVRGDSNGNSLGNSLDELGRHHDVFKPIIIEQVKKLVRGVPALFKQNTMGIQYYKDDGASEEMGNWEDLDCGQMFKAIDAFLRDLTADSSWGNDIIEAVKFEEWLGFLDAPNAPYNFITSHYSSVHLFTTFYDFDKDVSSFTPIAKYLIQKFQEPKLHEFLNFPDDRSYFDTLAHNPDECTEFMKSLNVLKMGLCTWSDFYFKWGMSPESYRQVCDLFGKEDGMQFISDLGRLLRKVVVEENLIRNSVPEGIAIESDPLPTHERLVENPKVRIIMQVPPEDKKPDLELRKTALFKNILQIRYVLFHTEHSISDIFKFLAQVIMSRRQDYAQIELRQNAVKINVKLAQVFYQLIDAHDDAAYIFVVSSMLLYSLMQKERGKDRLPTLFVVALLQEGVIEKLKEYGARLVPIILNNNIKLEYDEKHNLNNQDHLQKKSLDVITSIFATITNQSLYSVVPNISYYFHFPEGGFDVISSTVAYSFAIGIKLLEGCILHGFGSNPLDCIPVPIVERFVSIAVNVQDAKGLDTKGLTEWSKFVPLDWKNVTPPYDQIEYLKSIGLPETKAIHYFKHSTTLKDLASGEWTCPSTIIEDAELERISSKIKEDQVTFETVNVIDIENQLSFPYELFLPAWMAVAKKYPSLINRLGDYFSKNDAVASHFLENVVQDKVLLENNMGVVRSFFDCSLKEDKGVTEGITSLHNASMKRTIELLKADISLVNDDACANGLYIIEKGLELDEIVNPDLSKHANLKNITYPNIASFEFSSVDKETIFGLLLNIETLTNKASIRSVTIILSALIKDEKFRSQLAVSRLIGVLISSGSYFTTDTSKENQDAQLELAVLIRRCFETPTVIRNTMNSALDTFLQQHSVSRRELPSLVKGTSTLAVRDSKAFVSMITEKIRLQNYDGSRLFSSQIPITTTFDKDEVDDTQQRDSTKEISQSKVVHNIMSELMAVCKKDILSTPEGKEPPKKPQGGKKNDKILEVFLNPDFSYACFLLQMLAELLGSYMQCKLEFITYSKKDTDDSVKPRSTALNVLIHQLLPTHQLTTSSGIEDVRRASLSSLAKLAILALVSTPVLDKEIKPSPKKEDADMAFVRKFCTDIIIKALKDTSATTSSMQLKYSKLMDVFDLVGTVLSSKFRQITGPLLHKEATKFDQFYIARSFIDNLIPGFITSIVGTLDLNFPGIEKIIKMSTYPLTLLGKLKAEYQEHFEEKLDDKDEEFPDLDDEKEDDTPDLFRNSTLGMYDIEYDSEEEEEDAMDYYDGDLDVLMSGEEASDDEEEDDDDESDSDSDGMEEDLDDDIEEVMSDEEMGDSFHFHDNNQSGLETGSENDDSSDYDDDDIEIIDTTAVAVDDEGDEYYIEDYGYDEDEESSEYDEEVLDGWIRDLGDSDHEDNTNASNERSTASIGARSGTIPERDGADGFSDDGEYESTGDDDEALESSSVTPWRAVGEITNTIFDALRPAMNRNLVDAFGSIFNQNTGTNGESIGIIHVGRDGHVVGGLNNALENILSGAGGPSAEADGLNNLYIKSTVERWTDSLSDFQFKLKEKIAANLIPSIISGIADQSIELDKKLKDKMLQTIKEREEKRHKREEEERLRKEEEAKEREANLANNPREDREPVMVSIGDREVDISGTDIDPEFFEALPDDMREEVFTQHIRERRANASTAPGDSSREIDQDFLDALPEEIREEILQQESMTRYSYMRDEDDEAEEDEDHDVGTEEEEEDEAASKSSNDKKKKKIFFTPLIDRAGIAALVRLLFIPQTVNKRDNVYQSLKYLCYNKQTRVEVVNLIISILQDGVTNQKALDKIFNQLTMKASKQEKSTNVLPFKTSPIIVADQIMDLLHFLTENNIHIRYYLVTEHENPFLLRNKKSKVKGSLNKADRFQINSLLKLLDHKQLKEDPPFMDLLSRILQLTTRPLSLLKKKDKPIPFNPPYIPDHLLSKMVKFLTSNDCPNTTFRRAISAMQNLTNLKNAQKVFSLELSDQATSLGQTIIQDVNSLTKEIQGGSYDSESPSFAKFNASSSDQAKLLRVLTALDYMFESKERAEKDMFDDIEELTGLYKKLALGSLWDALSDCLKELEESTELANISTILLPLIEALMVVCKHSKVKDLQSKDAIKYEARRIDFTKEPIESLFFSFTNEHKKILNQMVRANPNLMSGPFGMLVRNPKVLEFDNKKNLFDRRLHEDLKNRNTLTISVRRDQVFLDSYRSLFFKSKDEFRNSKLDINFKGEQGVDAGGVTREWYQVLSKQMFNPDYALFTPVSSDANTYHPNRISYINPEHLLFFKFIGKVIGKAIFDNCFLDCHFSRAVYKRILGRKVTLKDMETLDLEYFKSLIWMLENDITDVITEDFLVETDDYGEKKIIDLIPNGRNIPVTEENKQEYVMAVVEYRLQTSVAEQMDNFLIGFHEIIPKDLISIFDEQELELLISGLPDIDVQDWQNNTNYNNYSASSIQIQWFWRAVKSFDNEERAKLLQFATGTSRVPLGGFKELSGESGVCKFSIHRDYGSLDRLPSSHTCFNQIDLPAYESYETLRGSVLLAITEGHEGFGFA